MVIFYGKQVALINLALFDNGTALSDFTVLVCDFFLGAYPFACFIKENASSGNLDFGFGKQLPFAENQMNSRTACGKSCYTCSSSLVNQVGQFQFVELNNGYIVTWFFTKSDDFFFCRR